MQKLLVAAAIAALAMSLAVQAQSGGVTANGWEARLDRGTDASSVLNFMTMGDGVHATTSGRGRGDLLAAEQHPQRHLHHQRVVHAGGAVGSSERVRPLLRGLQSVGRHPAVFVFRDPRGWSVSHQEADGQPDAQCGPLDPALGHPGARRAGPGDECALGGNRQQSGPLPGERHGGIVAAAIRGRSRRDLRAACQPPAERAHRRPPARYVTGRTDRSLTVPRSAVYTLRCSWPRCRWYAHHPCAAQAVGLSS